MASKVNKRKSASIKGILIVDSDNSNLFVDVEDIDKPFDLAEFLADFNWVRGYCFGVT